MINIDKYDAMEQQLQQIIDIGFDYDGYNSINSLKKLIDELVIMARDGLKGKRPYYIKLKGEKELYIELVTNDKGEKEERELSADKISEYTKDILIK